MNSTTPYTVAIYTDPDTNDQLITTVFVGAAFVSDENVYYVDGRATYRTQYTNADGNTRTGYIADVYLNGDLLDGAILYSDYGTGFYRLDRTDGDALRLTDATGAYPTENQSITRLYNDYLTAGGQSYDVSDAVIVDTTGDYEGTQISGIRSLLDSNYDVKVSVQFRTENSENVATYVYITDVVDADDTGMSVTSYTINGTAQSNYALYNSYAEAVAASATKMTASTSQAVALAASVDNIGASYVVEITNDGGNNYSTTLNTAASAGTSVLRITVTAADGVTTEEYYTAITVTGA